MLLPAILAFLLPIAIYCWVLAAINRRAKPTMVAGVWDCVGLLLAAAGIFLVVGPALIDRFFLTLIDTLPLDRETEPAFAEVLRERWYAWALYFTLVLSVVFLLLWRRRAKTVIYNVDPEMFEQVLRKSLDQLGLAGVRLGNRLIIEANSPASEPSASERGLAAAIPGERVSLHGRAELALEVFPSMCNVSLDWRRAEGNLRPALETQLARRIEAARVFDNPAANWLMGLTGLLFGLVFLTGMVWVLTIYFPRRW
jgi:hypothetical protein